MGDYKGMRSGGGGRKKGKKRKTVFSLNLMDGE